MPALDGLRALALVTVLAFHGGFPGLHGGYLPLTAFFVLSGFLITALLLSERTRNGSVSIARFWERRVRRLVPAAILGLVLVAAYLRFGRTVGLPSARGDVIASLTWVTNWRFILSDQPYAATFADPSPVQHYWSLAVEEQFYLVLPLLFVGLLYVGRGRRWVFAAGIAVMAAASTVWMAYLYTPGDAPLRAYFGTDTRAAELLIGVLLACVLVTRAGSLRQFRGAPQVALQVAGVVAFVASVGLWVVTPEYDDRLYEGGLVGVALLAAVVVAAATQPTSWVGFVLQARPLVWIGRLSYGIYLYHWPIFLWLTEAKTGLDIVPLFGLRMALTIGLAWLSLRYVELPIREGALNVRMGAISWANASVAVTALVVVAVVSAGLPTITLNAGAQDGELPPPPPSSSVRADDEVAAVTTTTTTTVAVADSSTTVPTTGSGPATTVTTHPTGTTGTTRPVTTTPPTAPPTTTPPPVRVMVVGDSVAKNLAHGLSDWQAQGAPIEVYDASINGCTYSRGGVRHMSFGEWPVPTECGWWATTTFVSRAGEFNPDVIVSHMGHNEMYGRTHPNWTGEKIPGDPVLDTFVKSEWVGAARAFTQASPAVLWLTMPCVNTTRNPDRIDNAEAARRIAHMNGNYTSFVRSNASVQIADLNQHLCAGGFTDNVDGVTGARPDGYHLTDEAALAVAKQWLGPKILAAAGR